MGVEQPLGVMTWLLFYGGQRFGLLQADQRRWGRHGGQPVRVGLDDGGTCGRH